MNQIKIGNFLKELRKEKNLTQEQIAMQFNVSRRTVSRWETATNLPDLDLLIEMADFYKVDLRELLDGERKEDKMDKELEETVLKIADYSQEEKEKINQRMNLLFIAGLIASLINMYLIYMDMAVNFFGGLCAGICTGMMVVGIIMTSKNASKIKAFKLRLLNKLK